MLFDRTDNGERAEEHDGTTCEKRALTIERTRSCERATA